MCTCLGKLITEPGTHTTSFIFGGGDRLKFEDVIIAVASLFVATWVINTLLNFVLIPASTSYGGDLAYILSALVAGLVIGYFYAGKIREESKMASIYKVIILFTVMMMFVMTMGAIARHYPLYIDEQLSDMYNTSSWTNAEWFWYELTDLMLVTTVYAVFSLLFGFIGVYLGSMRKPSAKTR
jgi:flagellar biosynthesis protein FliQ